MLIRLLVAISTSTALLASGGCTHPWAEPFAAPTHPTAAENVDVASSGAVAPDTASQTAAVANPQTTDSSNAAPELAGVLDQLQQIRAIDPTAEAKLMEQLRRTPADSWPLVAEQFRASLAYREQLVTNSGRLAIAKDSPNAQVAVLHQPTDSAADQSNAQADIQSHLAAPAESSSARVFPLGAMPAAFAADKSDLQEVPRGISAGVTNTVTQAAHTAATQPFDVRPADDWKALVAKAVDDMSRRVTPSPSTTAEVHQHVSLRMLRLLSGDTDGALEPIPGISPAEQDYWSRQIFALATYLDHHGQPDDKRRAAASVLHLDEAVSHLRELGSLSVRNLSFCKSAYGYGAIEPYDAEAFSPGEQVSLYVEVENYHSRSTEKGFCTLLGSTYEILNDNGERVGGGEIPDVNDCCRSRRRDFHIQYSLTLPEKIPPGRYQLQLVIKDRQSDKRGQATASFEIKGATSFATSPSAQLP
jgi:hypothetical protein